MNDKQQNIRNEERIAAPAVASAGNAKSSLPITFTRRISQVFFLALFLWLCVVSTLGTEFWRLRGWPVNWFIHLDPLAAIGTILTTHALYRGMVWAVATIVLTVVFGRFFCGWVCPFGTMQHFFGWLGSKGRKTSERITRNRYRKAQSIKYFFLLAFIVMATVPLGGSVSLQTGLLDPIPLVHRSVNIVLLPILARSFGLMSITFRQYEGAWVIGTVFLAALFLSFILPRFYCRFICPLGALLGILGRFAIWRIGKSYATCANCGLCEKACEGACEPSAKIRTSECVLCFNCLHVCPEGLISYRTRESAASEVANPDMGRRGFLLSILAGVMAIPMLRLAGMLGTNWHHRLIRPPGALPEEEFLKRCIKCGQCMRICPTNIIVPGGLEGGVESLWTPVLNFRSGTSGCQLNCTACGFICPTAAIRPITIAEKIGLGEYADRGPVRLGTAFVDRNRCLPWAMNIPCIVCQENCPVTPKAIYVRESWETVRDGIFEATRVDGATVYLKGALMKAGRYATGDYFCETGGARYRIMANTMDTIILEGAPSLKTGDRLEVEAHLLAPCVDVEKCIGCGTCEHECPVSGLRAIRVSAENESRSREHALLLKSR